MPARARDSKRSARTASQSGAASQSSSVMAMTSPLAALTAAFRARLSPLPSWGRTRARLRGTSRSTASATAGAAPPWTMTISSQSPCVWAAMERAVAPTVSGRVAATQTEILMPGPSTPHPLQQEAGMLLEAVPGGRAHVAPVNQAVFHLVAAELGVGDIAPLDLSHEGGQPFVEGGGAVRRVQAPHAGRCTEKVDAPQPRTGHGAGDHALGG